MPTRYGNSTFAAREHEIRLFAHPLLEQRELGLAHDERDHDLDDRVAAGLLAGDRGLHQCAHLHAVQAGLDDPEPAATGAEHRVRLAPHLGRAEQLLFVGGHRALRLLDDQLFVIGQELVQRRVEQTNRHRQAIHRFEDADEVFLLLRAQLLERGALLVGRVGQDHALHDREPVAQEHVLGAAQADAFRAELARLLRVLGQVGVRAHLQGAELVGPAEDRREVAGRLGGDDRQPRPARSRRSFPRVR